MTPKLEDSWTTKEKS